MPDPSLARARSPEFVDLVRAGCGAVLFGVPLLYTMEVWQIGSALPPIAGVVLIVVMIAIATVLDRTSGFRFNSPRSWSGSFVDGIEVVAVSLVISALALVLIGELSFDTSLRTGVLQVVAEALPLSIGGSIANEFLAEADQGDEEDASAAGGDARDVGDGRSRSVLAEFGGAAVGAIVIGFSIAPTDEVTTIVGQLSRFSLPVLMVASLVVSHALVFESGFRRSSFRSAHLGLDLGRTAIGYCTAIAISALMLAVYGRLGDGGDPRQVWAHVVTLAFPASVGASVGRLAA